MASNRMFEIVDNVLRSTVNYEQRNNSVLEVLFEVLDENGHSIVLVDNDTGRQWTSTELHDAIVTLGVKFSEYGISKGDFVAFFCPNSDLHAIAMLSLWGIGAIYTGLIHQSELKNVITKTNATYLVGSKETIDICNEFMSSNNTIKKFFVIDESGDENILSIHSLIESKVGNKEKEMFFELMSKLDSTDLCKVSFSSGTTGEPKPVKERHGRYTVFETKFAAQRKGILPEMDTCAVIQPLAHVGGSANLCSALLKGATVVVFSHFDCNNFIRDVEKRGITYATIVPAYLNLLNRSVSEPLKSFCLKKIATGGEFAQEIIIEEFIEKFKPEYFIQGYGTTEGGLATAVNISGGKSNPNCVGMPTQGCQIKIVDPETGKILGANKVAEICYKGPQTTDGYLNDEKATRESFDEQSFFKSGDIGYFDERGYLYIIDRIKELIKYNTQQVSPTELQNILLQHESVKEAAVIGMPDEVYGELPKAFVVLKREFKEKVKEDELLKFVNSRVMDFKRLRGGLTLMTELPKTSIGKIDRRALKSM